MVAARQTRPQLDAADHESLFCDSMADFRHEPMETREGRGLARRAWDGYARNARKVSDPLLAPLARRVSAAVVTDLVGFWLTWHLEGGFEGLERLGMHRATIFRKVSRF